VRVTVITTTSLEIIELTLNIDWHAKWTTSSCVCTLTNIKLSISNHHLQNFLTHFAHENLQYNHWGPMQNKVVCFARIYCFSVYFCGTYSPCNIWFKTKCKYCKVNMFRKNIHWSNIFSQNEPLCFAWGPRWLYRRFSRAKWVRRFCKWWWLLILNFIFVRVHTQNEVVRFVCQSIFNVNSIIPKDVVVITVTLTPSPSISSFLSIYGKFTLFSFLNMPYTKLWLTQTMLQKHSYNAWRLSVSY
jgi:hypothetical protein